MITGTKDLASMLTVRQVAEHLHMNPYTVRELLRNGDLIGFKIMGSRWRIKKSDLDDFVNRYLRKDE